MGHPGNWTPQKIAQVRSANAREAWARMARATYLDEGSNLYLSSRTPCDCYRDHRSLSVVAHCCGCLRAWTLAKADVMDSRFSHKPWSVVVRKMRCKVCDHPVERLVFFGELSKPLGSMVAQIPRDDEPVELRVG